MNKQRTVIGIQGFIFPWGATFTVPADGTASRTVKPGSGDDGWIDIGVADWMFSPQNTIEDFFAPSPGVRVLWDKVTTKKGLKLKGKLMELQNLSYKMLLAMASDYALSGAGGQYNPLEGDPVVRAWLQLQQYNQANALINTMDVAVAITLPGDVTFGDTPVDVDVEADVLFSTLNTGTLA